MFYVFMFWSYDIVHFLQLVQFVILIKGNIFLCNWYFVWFVCDLYWLCWLFFLIKLEKCWKIKKIVFGSTQSTIGGLLLHTDRMLSSVDSMRYKGKRLPSSVDSSCRLHYWNMVLSSVDSIIVYLGKRMQSSVDFLL